MWYLRICHLGQSWELPQMSPHVGSSSDFHWFRACSLLQGDWVSLQINSREVRSTVGFDRHFLPQMLLQLQRWPTTGSSLALCFEFKPCVEQRLQQRTLDHLRRWLQGCHLRQKATLNLGFAPELQLLLKVLLLSLKNLSMRVQMDPDSHLMTLSSEHLPVFYSFYHHQADYQLGSHHHRHPVLAEHTARGLKTNSCLVIPFARL